jgi:hypothetical protein
VALDETHSLFTAEIEGDEMSGGRYYLCLPSNHQSIKGSLHLVCIPLHGIYNSNGPDYQLCTLPPSPINPSARMRLDSDTIALRGPLQLWDPFIAFPLDLADTVAMEEDPNELYKSISMFCSLEHIRIFGRPLWISYPIEDTAWVTLPSGEEFDPTYKPLSPAQAFTILSFRVGLTDSVRSSTREWLPQTC